MHLDGYWISPEGEFIFMEKRHIDYIAECPEKFNSTRKEIDAIYEKHNEKK